MRPQLDDKVLASWNGLMLGALARACAVLGEEAYRAAAEKNLAFLRARLWDAEARTLYHRWRDGERDAVQLLEAYAFLLAGVIELYEATLEPAHLEFAVALAEAMLARFYDAENGGFWQSAAGAQDLILRVKEDYDGAEPSGNSVAILALLKLGKITDRKDFTQAAEKSLRLFAGRLQQVPQAVPCMLQALDFSLEEPRRAVVAGDPAGAKTALCCARFTRFISPTRWCWATPARSSRLPGLCRTRTNRWFICAAAPPASRRPVIRRESKKCSAGE